jgi:hypothetical protein
VLETGAKRIDEKARAMARGEPSSMTTFSTLTNSKDHATLPIAD